MQIAEAYSLQVRILHLSSLTPRFLNAGDGKHRFSPVLFDFRYFTDTAAAEARVESSRHLQTLEEEMREVSSSSLIHLATCNATIPPCNLQGYGVFLTKLWDLYARIVQLQQQALALLSNSPQVTNTHIFHNRHSFSICI